MHSIDGRQAVSGKPHNLMANKMEKEMEHSVEKKEKKSEPEEENVEEDMIGGRKEKDLKK